MRIRNVPSGTANTVQITSARVRARVAAVAPGRVRAMLSAILKMDLVTREEFEVQAAVLQKTREKLRLLEERIVALESGADHTGQNSSS